MIYEGLFLIGDKMIKLIASDLDGTLLQNGSTEVPREIFELIIKLKEKGIIFAAASGRQYYSLRNLFGPVRDDIAYICENGALTIYQGEIIDRQEIPKELGQEIIKLIEAEEGTEALVSGTYTLYINPKSPDYEERIRFLGNQYKVLSDLSEIGEPYIKIALYEKAGTEDNDRQKYWQEKMPEGVKVVTSGNDWLDMLFPWIHKGVGMKALSKHLGIKKEETMSFGDNYNDVEMFETSGVAVAVNTQKEGLLKRCAYSADTVAGFLKDYFPDL